MPTQPMQFTPEYTSDESGNPVYTGEGSVSTFQRGGIVYEQAFQEDELTGERFSLIDESDYATDNDYQETASYEELLVEAMPDLPAAMNWAGQVLSPEQIEDFNSKMDSGDPGEYMDYLENIYEMYLEAEGIEDEEDDSLAPEDEEDEVSQEQLNEVISELADSEPLGTEAAMPWLEMAIEHQTSNPCLSAICEMTSRFHNNEIEYGEALDALVAKYPLSELKKYYNYLNN